MSNSKIDIIHDEHVQMKLASRLVGSLYLRWYLILYIERGQLEKLFFSNLLQLSFVSMEVASHDLRIV